MQNRGALLDVIRYFLEPTLFFIIRNNELRKDVEVLKKTLKTKKG